VKIKGFQDTINWYNQNAAEYSKSNLDYISLDLLKEFSDLISFKRVLDAGCAAGRDSQILSENGFEVTGIDISSEFIKIAKKNNPNITFIEGNFLDLPFENNSFGGVWAHASLVHLETVGDVKKSLSEFYRVLKDNGIIHILVKAKLNDKKFAVVSDKLSKHDRFFQYFTSQEVEDLTKQAGFKKIKLEQYKEIDKNPKGRNDVEWIYYLGKKS
jgi:ubiquinone/menaquinone biosynthesis C-methylase UbiE